jgi:hypothetical protein
MEGKNISKGLYQEAEKAGRVIKDRVTQAGS